MQGTFILFFSLMETAVPHPATPRFNPKQSQLQHQCQDEMEVPVPLPSSDGWAMVCMDADCFSLAQDKVV